MKNIFKISQLVSLPGLLILLHVAFTSHAGITSVVMIGTDTVKTSSDSTKTSTEKESRIKPGEQTTYDWLKLLDGTEMEVEVRKISEKFVFFSEPGNMETDYIDRRKVQTVYYRSGRIENMTSRETEIRAVKDWKEVEITNNPEDVVGMIKVEEHKMGFQATTRHHYYKPETLETSAEIQIRKEAGLKGADIVLITKREHHRAYGDPPIVTLWGTSYRKL
ncbi:MAG TPA: hypothetical protein PL017_10050 [Tenuifilaceae bacterium]|nr:hypothetical protein [Tenuifilaceae bacterium]HPE17745.1 hypothetical protein [Tenuifilaceae bacterium]HPJ46430.1 hypothetical protein [Tenuifilaceae bacterium]HPQ34987.1 hypothetical protein [Tenuifilaceae bacterium]HRX68669.1 hypothetical protein [Tenuifilaceae bacterium]